MTFKITDLQTQILQRKFCNANCAMVKNDLVCQANCANDRKKAQYAICELFDGTPNSICFFFNFKYVKIFYSKTFSSSEICLHCLSIQFAIALNYFQSLLAEFVFAHLSFKNLVGNIVFALLRFKKLVVEFALAL